MTRNSSKWFEIDRNRFESTVSVLISHLVGRRRQVFVVELGVLLVIAGASQVSGALSWVTLVILVVYDCGEQVETVSVQVRRHTSPSFVVRIGRI